MRAAAASVAAGAARRLPPLRGRGRLALALHPRWALPAGTTWTIPMRRGHRMRVPAGSAQSWRAAFTGRYDDEEIDLLLGHAPQGTFVLDVGASLGFYTVPLAAALLPRGGRVLAVEPVGANRGPIPESLELNGLAVAVDVAPVALGRAPGAAVLHVEGHGAGNAAIVSGLDAAEVARHDRAGGTGRVEHAEVVRLDDLPLPPACGGMGCSVVKIDTEGYELGVLDGGAAFVARHRPVILAEFHPHWMRSRGEDPSAPVTWAAEHGYRAAELVHTRTHPLSDRHRLSLAPLEPGTARSGTCVLLVPEERGR